MYMQLIVTASVYVIGSHDHYYVTYVIYDAGAISNQPYLPARPGHGQIGLSSARARA